MARRIFFIVVALALSWRMAAAQTGWLPTPGSGNATLSVTNASANVALPGIVAGLPAPPTVRVCNTGASNAAYVLLGGSTVTASTSTGYLVNASTCTLFALGTNTYLAGITSSSTTTLEIEVGTGSPQANGSSGSAAPIGAASGDLGGNYPAPTVVSGAHLTGTLATGLTIPNPTLSTPTLGVATATTINKWAFTAPTTAATLTAGGDNLTYTMPAASKTIAANDLSNVTMSQDCTNASAVITCTKTNNVAFTAEATAAAGQLTATATNDSAGAGKLGEYINATSGVTSNTTVTFTNGSANIGWTAHNLKIGSVVNFTTTGALPTNFTVGTNYYVSVVVDANTINVSATPFGSNVSAGSAGSGTQTGVSGAVMSNNTAMNMGALSLTAGDWDVRACVTFLSASTSATSWLMGINLTSATGPTTSDTITAGTGPASQFFSAAISAAQVLCAPPGRLSISGTTTVFLFAKSAFTGTESANGFISARRVR